MTDRPAKVREALRGGDPAAAMRELRRGGDELGLAEAAPLVAEIADAVGFEDLARAARALGDAPGGAGALYAYGYACVGRGVPFLAVPALAEALRLAVGPPPSRGLFGRARRQPAPEPQVILAELAVALEDEERHAEAVDVLERHQGILRDWPDRYLLARNAVLAGDLGRARRTLDALPPGGPDRQGAADRVRRALDRAAVAGRTGPPGLQDLRAWHFVLTGGLLGTLSPYGFAAGMTGRYAYLGDSYEQCRHGLDRLRLILDAAGQRPRSVSLLPDRGSRALGLAAARLSGLPAEPYRPGTPDTLVVAYDLNELDEALVPGLRARAAGEVLYEHVTCWTSPPPVSADVSTLLAQFVRAPWDAATRYLPGDDPVEEPADPRPAEELAADICAADPGPDTGDGDTPPDPDEALAAFVRAVRGRWLTGPRDQVRSSGPVRSSRFD
ncbi:hypothetical protein GCM10018781_10950 [Kitasatospora indigofera]|uniref:Uncharacterized protein n=1 Tax=Kitasatospora indigofera TaxID=67307 RepID=A0A919FE06_9ACTN|nr:hypothetical protein [Kitasatospora indigofera]GHH62686.1 hypothetical protein GCM10018781_10950 [Kitasatospora indigofera]